MDRINTVSDLVTRYGLSERLILDSIRKGELKAHRLGIVTLIFDADFLDFVKRSPLRGKSD